MAIELTIKNAETSASISISANISEFDLPIEFKNTAMKEIRNMDESIDPQFPFVTYKAIEAACISGAVYARRKMGVSGLSVELLSFSKSGKVENAQPFAVAIMIAASKIAQKEVNFSKSDLSGWQASV